MADLRFSRRALASISRQLDFLDNKNPTAANAVLADISRSCDLLTEYPRLGRAIEDTGLRYVLTHKFRYRVIYRVAGDSIEVRDVMHPRQR